MMRRRVHCDNFRCFIQLSLFTLERVLISVRSHVDRVLHPAISLIIRKEGHRGMKESQVQTDL